jgi:serine/threonine protein kinase
VRPSLPGNIYRVKASGLFSLSEVVDATCRCMLKALRHLSANGIVHRDVRPANILYAEDPKTGDLTLKLANFGLRIDAAEHPALGLRLDPYRSPEAAQQLAREEARTHASDMWALFATLAELADQYRPGANRTYHEAWARLYAIATAKPARGALDLRGMKEAVIWEADRRATASQMLAKFYETPGSATATQRSGSIEFMSWDAWTARVGGEAVAKGLYDGTRDPRSLLVARGHLAHTTSSKSGKPGKPKDKTKSRAASDKPKISVALPEGWLDIESADDAAGTIGADMRKAIRGEIKRVIEEEIRQCDDAQLRKALELELKELLSPPGLGITRDEAVATLKTKLEKARTARNEMEYQLKEVKTVLASQDEQVKKLAAGMEEANKAHSAETKTEHVGHEREPEARAGLETRLREAIRAKEASEVTLKELLEARDASDAQVREAINAKEAAESRVQAVLQEKAAAETRANDAVEAQSVMKAELDHALVSLDELCGQVQQLEEALQSRDAMITRLQSVSKLPADTVELKVFEQVSGQLREALDNRDASETQMKEAIEARAALKTQLREALESRDLLKTQLQLLEEERDHANRSLFRSNNNDQQKHDGVVDGVLPSIEDDIGAQIKAAMQEKETVEAELKQVAMDRLATEAKLKDAVGARRSAEEQIRKASVAREDVEAALERIRRERNSLKAQVRKNAAMAEGGKKSSDGAESGEDGPDDVPAITYRMDPLVEAKHKHFLGLEGDSLMERRRDELASNDNQGSTAKRRKIITEFGNPSTTVMERHSTDFMSGSSGDRRIRILC